MYRDDNYKINPAWPKRLLEMIAEMDEIYDNNDDFKYSLLEGVFESHIKAFRLNGKITEKDLDTLFRRYGWR
mgnify:CR=1 FL=1